MIKHTRVLVFGIIFPLTACAKPIDTSKLKVIEVQLLSVSAGYRRDVNIEFLDLSRDMKFNKEISCSSWDAAEKLSKRIGEIYKVYDTSSTVVPDYYRLSERFCKN